MQLAVTMGIMLSVLTLNTAISNSAHDGGSALSWFPGGASNENNIKIIKDCLDNNADKKKACSDLKLESNAANWGGRAAQFANEWSMIGQEYLEQIVKENPDKAKLIHKTQVSWYTYISNTCELGSQLATYQDDDENGNHPPFYDWVTNISCIYDLTMDRVISLHTWTKNLKHN
ncbi:MAG: hypothetical protein J0M34_01400 [Alphaproteobacteria bacterium]|nr:hypothetical protein [Alphaproteobacteria bacterium]